MGSTYSNGSSDRDNRPVQNIRNSVRYPQLSRTPMFAGFDDVERVAIIDNARLIHLNAPKELLQQGEASPGMFIVAQGAVEISYLGPTGDRFPLLIATPGTCMGTTEALSGTLCTATCRATAGTSVLFIDKEVVTALAKHPLFISNYAAFMQATLARFNDLRAADKTLSVENRISRYLLDLMERNGTIRQSQSFIGEAAGCSRQTVNKAIGHMREEGILTVEKGVIHILDVTALERKADLHQQS